MKFAFEIVVGLKPGLLDPQGKAVEAALPAMGWTGVSDVRIDKHITLVVDIETEARAVALADEIARKLLSNPVIENHRIVSMAPVQGLTFEARR